MKTYIKQGTGILFIGASLSLSACAGFEIFKYDSLPVVHAVVQTGATRASVEAAGGKPLSEVKVSQNSGSCLNYTLAAGANTTQFFVLLNKDDRVTSYGYVSCQTAIDKGYALPSEPMKKH